jgi:hypothetical protein
LRLGRNICKRRHKLFAYRRQHVFLTRPGRDTETVNQAR